MDAKLKELLYIFQLTRSIEIENIRKACMFPGRPIDITDESKIFDVIPRIR